jgi:NADPH:quinone reductase-like Zn-dependent oxidoreductase
MKAVRFHQHGEPEVLRYEEAPDPTPRPTEVLLRVKAVALNHLDVWLRKGLPGMKVPLPKIGGCDIAGEVVAVGTFCSRVAVGQRILASPGISCGQCAACLRGDDNLCRHFKIIGGYVMDGGCAELVCVPEVNCIALPDSLDYAGAAAVPVAFLTAWNMLVRQAHLAAGEEVLVMGAGSGVGTAAVQIAKLFSARVIAVAGTDEKLAKAKELGADEVINYSVEHFDRRVRKLTGGRGVDLVVEHVGTDTWQQSIGALAPLGRIVTCGSTTGRWGNTDLWSLFGKQLSLIGSFGATTEELAALLPLVVDGTLKPVIDRTFPLEQAADAHRYMAERRQFGKLVLVV